MRSRYILRIVVPTLLTVALFVVTIFLVFIPGLERGLMDRKREMIHELTASAWNILASFEQEVAEGRLSRAEAQQEAVRQFRNLHYGPQMKDYFWINDLTPRMIAHPYRHEMEGQDLSGIQDPDGKRLFVEFAAIARAEGGGFVQYRHGLPRGGRQPAYHGQHRHRAGNTAAPDRAPDRPAACALRVPGARQRGPARANALHRSGQCHSLRGSAGERRGRRRGLLPRDGPPGLRRARPRWVRLLQRRDHGLAAGLVPIVVRLAARSDDVDPHSGGPGSPAGENLLRLPPRVRGCVSARPVADGPAEGDRRPPAIFVATGAERAVIPPPVGLFGGIEGNHEDFERLPRLVSAYRDIFTYLPRGSLQTMDGRRRLCLGGAAYMDAHTTPRGATIGPADVEACLRHPRRPVDLILTHDCPRGIGVANAPGFEHYGPPGFDGGDRLVAHFSPRLWLFGHHHRWIESRLGETRCLGLPQSWKGYALLDGAGRLETVRHFVPSPRTCGILRLWRRMTKSRRGFR